MPVSVRARAVAQRITLWFTLAALAPFALSGCAHRLTKRPITPAPAPRKIDIPGVHAGEVFPGADGIALLSSEASGSGSPALTFYRFGDSSLTSIWTATNGPDGTPNNVLAAAYEGSQIIFETSTALDSDWVVWSYDVTTGQRSTLLSYASYPQGAMPLWAAGPSDLLWTTVTSGGPYGAIHQLMDYNYATGQSRLLYSSPSALITPLAVNSKEALFMLADVSAAPPTIMAQWLNQAAPAQLSEGRAGSGVMTETYAAWDDLHVQTVSAYAVNTGELLQNIEPCMKPALDDTGPYLVCMAAGGSSGAYLLIHLPDSGTLPFGAGMASGGGVRIYHGRGYFAGPDGAVYEFDLPAR